MKNSTLHTPLSTLYMLPCPISDEGEIDAVLPAENIEVMRGLDYFVVENLRSARRFLSRAGLRPDVEMAELNEHTTPQELERLIEPLLRGRDGGMISEAGVPGVADPGAELAALCHRHGIAVRPLVGPSSILLALMASGLNGQSFAFVGYLPVKPPERAARIRFLERRANAERQSQIFIEAPYRNVRLFDELLRTCRAETMLCVATSITAPASSGSPGEQIATRTIAEWRTSVKPAIDKSPTIFIMG